MQLVQPKVFLYIRYEYKYLQQYLESILQKARETNYLGKNIQGKKGFNLISAFSLVPGPMFAVKNQH